MMNPVFASATTAIRVNDGATQPASDDLAGVSALAFTLVGKVENAGEFGGENQTTDFIPLDTGIVEKVSGAENLGEMPLTIGVSEGDAGQAVLKAAQQARTPIYVEVDMPNGIGGRTVEYLKAIVTSFRTQINDANSVMMVSANLQITAVYS